MNLDKINKLINNLFIRLPFQMRQLTITRQCEQTEDHAQDVNKFTSMKT